MLNLSGLKIEDDLYESLSIIPFLLISVSFDTLRYVEILKSFLKKLRNLQVYITVRRLYDLLISQYGIPIDSLIRISIKFYWVSIKIIPKYIIPL
jgi:hypothetical protein